MRKAQLRKILEIDLVARYNPKKLEVDLKKMFRDLNLAKTQNHKSFEMSSVVDHLDTRVAVRQLSQMINDQKEAV